VRTEAFAIDAQAQGEVGGMQLGVYVTHAKSKASDQNGGPENLFNAHARDKKATTITAELSLIPNRLTALVGYRKGDTGEDQNSGDNAITVGANFKLRQNLILQLVHSKFSGSHYDSDQSTMQPGGTGNALTTFMLSAGF
jgi:predicted porin